MRLPSLDRVHIVCSRIPFVTVVSQAPSQSSSSTRSFWCPVPPTPKETRCANNPGERSAQTDAGTRHHCTAPPTDQAVPPGNWSLDQGTPQRGRHGHRAIHRPALLRGTAGRPVARPTRRKGIKARGRSLTPARGGYGGNDGYAGEPIERGNQMFLSYALVEWSVVAYLAADAYVFVHIKLGSWPPSLYHDRLSHEARQVPTRAAAQPSLVVRRPLA